MTDLSSARWPDVEAARRDVLVVPVGSLEQHGPHLPLDTDTCIARAVAERLCAVRPGSGLAPALPVGASGEHAAFPGTLSIGTEALRLLVVELVRHAAGDWGAVLLVNGHGGNRDGLARAAELCATEGRRVAVVHLGTRDMDAHAGLAETSLLLHLAPERVRLDLAAPGAVAPMSDLLPRLRDEGVRAVTPNGVLGDPTGASAEAGERWLNALLALAISAYDRLVDEP